jgi:hypothetical protein
MTEENRIDDLRNIPLGEILKGKEDLMRALSKEELDKLSLKHADGMKNSYVPQSIRSERNQLAGIPRQSKWWTILGSLTEACLRFARW